MREVNLGDLSFSPGEQELLRRETRAAHRDISSPSPSWAVGIACALFVVIGLSIGHQNAPATYRAPAGSRAAQPAPAARQQADPAAAIERYSRGVGYRQRNEYAQGIPELDQAINLKPDFAEAYEERGYAYLMLGRHESAIRDLNAALRLKPNDALTYAFRGVAYAWSGNYQTAIQDFNAAIRLNPNEGFVYLQRGIAYVNLKQYQRGIENYDRAIEVDPSLADAYTYREKAMAAWEADGSRVAEPDETDVIVNLAGTESPTIEYAPSAEVRINYALYVEAVNPWTDTQIAIRKGDVVTIRATGTIHPCIWNNCRDVRFNRWISASGFVTLPYLFGFPSMALVGRIADSSVFLVGESVSVVSPSDGILYLGVNDIPNSFSDNAGRFTVTVAVRRTSQ
jgi:tetratricopeptide (TPR) repeat protein